MDSLGWFLLGTAATELKQIHASYADSWDRHLSEWH